MRSIVFHPMRPTVISASNWVMHIDELRARWLLTTYQLMLENWIFFRSSPGKIELITVRSDYVRAIQHVRNLSVFLADTLRWPLTCHALSYSLYIRHIFFAIWDAAKITGQIYKTCRPHIWSSSCKYTHRPDLFTLRTTTLVRVLCLTSKVVATNLYP